MWDSGVTLQAVGHMGDCTGSGTRGVTLQPVDTGVTVAAVGHWFTGPGGDATDSGTQGVTPQAVGHKG